MKRIILDTNFLMIPFQFKVDIFSEIERVVEDEFEICVLDKSMDELKKLQGPSADGRAAKAAIAIVAKNKLTIVHSPTSYVDAAIVEMAEPGKTIVATQDQKLKMQLKYKNVPIITMRAKKHLILVEP
jgi:uncharacterized protein